MIISAGFENVGNNYAMMVSGYQAITLNPGDDFVTYSVYCTPSSPVSNVKAVVYLGRNLDVDMKASKDNPIDVTLDGIFISESVADILAILITFICYSILFNKYLLNKNENN